MNQVVPRVPEVEVPRKTANHLSLIKEDQQSCPAVLIVVVVEQEGCSKDPHHPKSEQLPSHMAILVSDDDKFREDPQQVILTAKEYGLPLI